VILQPLFAIKTHLRAAAVGARRRLRGEINWIFIKNPIYLSPKTPLVMKTDLSNYNYFSKIYKKTLSKMNFQKITRLKFEINNINHYI